ncbi:isocitrate lyase [Batrachochytrium salamandrivorans]|nr:isocitrate lyase [Batrachochytrium salamandrivorans]
MSAVAPPSALFLEEEQQAFDTQVQEVGQWWSSSRFSLATRPYSASDVVSKRGTLPISIRPTCRPRSCGRSYRHTRPTNCILYLWCPGPSAGHSDGKVP